MPLRDELLVRVRLNKVVAKKDVAAYENTGARRIAGGEKSAYHNSARSDKDQAKA